MLPVAWLESFSEEEATVKRVSTLPNDFLFFEHPVQKLDPDELPDEYIAAIRTHSRFDQSSIQNVSCVISRSTGYDHLVEQDERFGGIPAGYLSEYATQAVAEHNLTISLALLKHLNAQQKAMKQFRRNDLTGLDLHDRAVGIVGVGKIGEATARLFMNLGLSVTGHDLHEKNELQASDSFEYTGLTELFETCNLIVLCLPHTKKTEDLIGTSLLETLPDNSVLVNSGRGEVVSSQALLDVLEHGPLAGIGLDVYRHEDELAEALGTDSEPDSPTEETRANLDLIEDERVIATPHNAFNSRGSVETKVRNTLQNIERFNRGETLLNPIN